MKSICLDLVAKAPIARLLTSMQTNSFVNDTVIIFTLRRRKVNNFPYESHDQERTKAGLFLVLIQYKITQKIKNIISATARHQKWFTSQHNAAKFKRLIRRHG